MALTEGTLAIPDRQLQQQLTSAAFFFSSTDLCPVSSRLVSPQKIQQLKEVIDSHRGHYPCGETLEHCPRGPQLPRLIRGRCRMGIVDPQLLVCLVSAWFVKGRGIYKMSAYLAKCDLLLSTTILSSQSLQSFSSHSLSYCKNRCHYQFATWLWHPSVLQMSRVMSCALLRARQTLLV